MSTAPLHRLRLVALDDAVHAPLSNAESRAARRSVAAENRAAAHGMALDPADPRWRLALRTHEALQGATLTPERRQALQRLANRLGVRPFDASLIMAIVQDQAREGGSLADAATTVAMLRTPRDSRAARARWLLAAVLALLAAVGFALWLVAAS